LRWEIEVLALPDGYKVGPTDKRAKIVHHKMLGDEWTTVVYYRGYPAFEISKQFGIYNQSPKYAGRIGTGQWQEFKSVPEMVRVMCAKHRIGVKA